MLDYAFAPRRFPALGFKPSPTKTGAFRLLFCAEMEGFSRLRRPLHRQLQTFPHRSVCRTMSPKPPRFFCPWQRFGAFAPRRFPALGFKPSPTKTGAFRLLFCAEMEGFSRLRRPLHRQLQTFPHRSVCRTMSPKPPRFFCPWQRFGAFAPRRFPALGFKPSPTKTGAFRLLFCAEMEGFEPSRRLPDLSDFKSDTFSLLVTSPKCIRQEKILGFLPSFVKGPACFFRLLVAQCSEQENIIPAGYVS